MYIYKKLKVSDTAIVPFNTHKGHYYRFPGGPAPSGAYDDPSQSNFFPGTSGSGIRILPAYWEQKPLVYYSASNQRHRQLEQLFYRDYPYSVVDKMGNVDYSNQKRYLDKEAIVFSIPQELYGTGIQPGSFRYVNYVSQKGWLGPTSATGFMATVVDDGKGNLYIPEVIDKDRPNLLSMLANQSSYPGIFNSSSYETTSSYKYLKLDDPKHNILKINPKNGYKHTQLQLDEYGVKKVNPPGHTIGVDWNELKITQSGDLIPNPYWYSHGVAIASGGAELNLSAPITASNGRTYNEPMLNPSLLNKKWIYDDSYYFNLLEYKDIMIWPNHEIYGYSYSTEFDAINYGHLWTGKGCPQPGTSCVGGMGIPSRAYINPMVFWGRHRANDTGSYIKSPHNEKFNMNVGDDFTVSFWMYKYNESGSFSDSLVMAPSGAYGFNSSPSRSIGIEMKDQYLIAKSRTKTDIPPPSLTSAGIRNIDASGSSEEFETIAEPQYPFEILYHPIGETTLHTILSSSITCSYVDETGSLNPICAESTTCTPVCDTIVNLSGSVSASSTEVTSGSIIFRRSDGLNTVSASLLLTTGSNVWTHITCRYSASKLEIFEDGAGVAWENRNNTHYSTFMNCSSSSHGVGPFLSASQQIYPFGGSYVSSSDAISDVRYHPSGVNSWNPTSGGADLGNTQNTANVYIGSKGGVDNFYEGCLYAINMWDYALDDHEIWHVSRGSGLISGDTHVGNIFYESGIATITNPLFTEYATISSSGPNWSWLDWSGLAPVGFISHSWGNFSETYTTESIEFRATHPIYENEYQCTIDESEFNFTNNITARKIRSEQCGDIADFATGSNFKPYITRVGLYNEANELLVVGNLGQPVRISDETDTTIVLRWDT